MSDRPDNAITLDRLANVAGSFNVHLRTQIKQDQDLRSAITFTAEEADRLLELGESALMLDKASEKQKRIRIEQAEIFAAAAERGMRAIGRESDLRRHFSLDAHTSAVSAGFQKLECDVLSRIAASDPATRRTLTFP
jgi:hypothetical protein